MTNSIIAMTLGIIVVFCWVTACAFVLRAFGVRLLPRTPEERDQRKQNILRMGKVRYVLIYGILSNGAGMGLGTAVALVVARGIGWSEALFLVVGIALVGGLFNGLRSWNAIFRTEIPFPPAYPPQE